jgi:DNA repair photolyase
MSSTGPRGQVWNPPNRFDPVEIEWEEEPGLARLELVEDASHGALTENRSPDVGFRWSVNPYRGCTHACAYCYARPFHEFLGWGAGTDFERKILVKVRAPELLEAELRRPSWTGEHVVFSGVTDAWQPLERRYGLTRRCLEVLVRFRNPVGVITRSALVARDLDLFQSLAEHGAVGVTFSLPLPDRALARALEPGAPSPEARLAAMKALADAGIPVGVSIGPIIPALGDALVPEALTRARDAGARWAWPILLRLPGAVAPVFERRLREALPLRADAVMAKIRRMRGGALDDAAFGRRMKGRDDDPAWRTVRDLFGLFHDRLGFGPVWTPPERSPFRVPSPQLGLFG